MSTCHVTIGAHRALLRALASASSTLLSSSTPTRKKKKMKECMRRRSTRDEMEQVMFGVHQGAPPFGLLHLERDHAGGLETGKYRL